MGAPRLMPALTEYLLANPGVPIPLTQMCADTGFEYGQTQAAMYRIIRDDKLPGTRVLLQGSMWQYDPGAAPQPAAPEVSSEPTWYYEIGTVKGGNKLVRAEGDPTIYVLKPLDI
jgi:hypothetical protein